MFHPETRQTKTHDSQVTPVSGSTHTLPDTSQQILQGALHNTGKLPTYLSACVQATDQQSRSKIHPLR
jgi:hypothetical protein